ncbi:MAG: type I-E CRISPR-associated protein Cas7/Cse4/CasC [Methanosarcina sp.]|nr:type I-E CRISPR-associated protein Cas7/Cse4/CasC [Methanosarcina sp.]
MTDFIQLHILTSYPPSNLNRDDLGRPKTAVMGGTQRLRISSQSLKRAWRTSDIFMEALSGHIGVRTKEMGNFVYKALTTGVKLTEILEGKFESSATYPKMEEKKAAEISKQIASVFGKLKKEGFEIEQLAHFSPEEIGTIENLIIDLAQSGRKLTEDDRSILRKNNTAVDIAMFGRMLAANTQYNVEAAVQVSHAITAHKVAVEDDFFTAVDDLNDGEEDMGSGHLGETEFAAGLFYIYTCINRDLLKENLEGDEELTKKALKALVEAALTVSPTGKQNSFASRAYASYVLVEKGKQQPRSLSVAFLKALEEKDLLGSTIKELNNTREKIENVYGKCCEKKEEMNAYTGEGSIQGILKFVAE